MAKPSVTPGEWYIDQEGDISTTDAIVGDVVCLKPEEYLHSMDYWPANARLLAQAKRMYELLKQSLDVRFDNTGESEAWFESVGYVLEAINGHP